MRRRLSRGCHDVDRTPGIDLYQSGGATFDRGGEIHDQFRLELLHQAVQLARVGNIAPPHVELIAGRHVPVPASPRRDNTVAVTRQPHDQMTADETEATDDQRCHSGEYDTPRKRAGSAAKSALARS